MERRNKREYQPFEDPKIILTTSLLRQRDGIVAQINVHADAAALQALATLIAQIYIEPNEKDLLDAKAKLIANAAKPTISANDVMYYFELLSDYLNRTYFADYHKARPKVTEVGTI